VTGGTVPFPEIDLLAGKEELFALRIEVSGGWFGDKLWYLDFGDAGESISGGLDDIFAPLIDGFSRANGDDLLCGVDVGQP
jgi:hypothetical protein